MNEVTVIAHAELTSVFVINDDALELFQNHLDQYRHTVADKLRSMTGSDNVVVPRVQLFVKEKTG